MCGHFTYAFEMYNNALELIEWGRKKWPNVPDSDKGVIFKKTFIRAIKRLHLGLMHAVSQGFIYLAMNYC